MFDVLSKLEAVVTKNDILTVTTLINGFVRIDFSEFTAIAIEIVLFAANLFRDQLFLNFILFLFDFSHDFRRLLVPTKWAFDNPIILELMLGPLRKAVQMKGISADSGTRSSCITFDNLHVADSTKIILLLIFFLLDYHAPFGNFHLDVFEKVGNFVFVNAPIGNNVPKLFIVVIMLK